MKGYLGHVAGIDQGINFSSNSAEIYGIASWFALVVLVLLGMHAPWRHAMPHRHPRAVETGDVPHYFQLVLLWQNKTLEPLSA
jgi:hypothetical protein